MEASLYIHVPFCAGTCDYCDFYSVPLTVGDSRPERFVQNLLSEAERLFDEHRPGSVPTLYIGGGTPSVLGAARIRRLLGGLLPIIRRYSPPPGEITVEANPESADEAFLAAAREGGVTRLSLGVQSFHGPSRRAVHRVGAGDHRAEALLHRRLTLAAEYFPGAFSADIISGLPFQNERILLDDIAALESYKPAHVSLYALTLEPETPLALNASQYPLPPQDEADRLWLCGRGALEKSGFAQYEVSNFCRAGKESQHNIRYWRMKSWLALGPAASSTIIDDETGTAVRRTIPKDADVWLAGKPPEITEPLDSLTLIKESFLMGFRYTEGPDGELFRRRFRRTIAAYIPQTLKTWQARGFLQKDKTALTKEGLLFLDRFLLDAFQELELFDKLQ